MPETVFPLLGPQARWDDLDAFRVIYAGVKRGKTIQEIGMSTPHPHGGPRLLYLRLARLEEALGTHLIDRKRWSREPHVTPAGERLAASLAELSRFRERLACEFRSRRPELTVATTMTVNSLVFPHFLAWVRARRGDLGLDLHFREGQTWATVTQMVRGGQADVGLAGRPVGQPAAPDLREELFTPEDAVLLCPSDHRLARRSPTGHLPGIRDLTGETFILHPGWFAILPDVWKKAVRLQVPHYVQMRPFVRRGGALSAGWRTMEDMDPLPGLTALPFCSPIRERWVLLLAPHFPSSPGTPVREFLEDLRAFVRTRAAPRSAAAA